MRTTFFGLLLILPCLCFGQAFSPVDIPFVAQAGGTDWELRVIANGGARPPATDVTAMEYLRTTMISMSLTSKIWNLVVAINGNEKASFTPLFYHKGWSYWTNTFVDADININGAKGDGSTKMADSGVKAIAGQALTAAGSGGLSALVTEVPRGPNWLASNALKTLLGRVDPDGDPAYQLGVTVNGRTFFIPGDTASANNYVNPLDFCAVGFTSGNVDQNTADDIRLYRASPLETYRILDLDATVAADMTVVENTITAFCMRRGETNEAGTFTTNRVSMLAIHDYLTQDESSNFWYAVRTTREMMGGGTGDPVHDWNATIVANGGAAVSSTTSNAARYYLNGMDTYGLRILTAVGNIFVPDNLLASRTPVLWRGGHPIWANTGFDTTNLSVFGLDSGPSGKYLRTGVSNTISTELTAFFGTSDFGYSVMATNWPATTVLGGTSDGNQYAFLVPTTGPAAGNNGHCQFGIGAITSGVNESFLVCTNFFSGHTNYGMWTSGNRVSATSLALFVAAQSIPHYQVTNDAAASAGSLANNIEVVACGLQSDASPLTFTGAGPGAMAYTAIHRGMTQAQSSNHYAVVYQTRVMLGGGNR